MERQRRESYGEEMAQSNKARKVGRIVRQCSDKAPPPCMGFCVCAVWVKQGKSKCITAVKCVYTTITDNQTYFVFMLCT